MDIKREISFYKSDNLLLSDSSYYKYIFKKTEKIVCAVFYVFDKSDKGHIDRDIAAQSLLGAAKKTLDSALATLSRTWFTAAPGLHEFLHALLALESHIRVGQAVALVQEEVADLLSLEIQTVVRGLRQYLAYERKSAPDAAMFAEDETAAYALSIRRRTEASARNAAEDMRSSPHAPASTSWGSIQSKGQDKGHNSERRTAIKDILASKGHITLKDICERLPSYSEKMIQREITSMIKDGIIIKEGERRWSRYSLVLGT